MVSATDDVTFTRLRSPVRKEISKVWAGPLFLDETYINRAFACAIMGFADELLQKIPIELHQHEHFKHFREIAALQHIQSKEQLIQFLDRQIDQGSAWLKSNNMTGVAVLKQMTSQVARLERYKLWKEWCAYL